MAAIQSILTTSIASAVLLGGCATYSISKSESLDGELSELIELYTGDYFSDADGGAREGRAIYMRVREISPPEDKTHALYSEMRHDGPDGEFYRQVILTFDETADRSENRMMAVRITDKDAGASLIPNPDAFKNGDVPTRPALSEDCYTVWSRSEEGFSGYVDPERCVITGKRGDQRRIEARTVLSADTIGQYEAGFTLEGERLFGNEEGQLYIWPRVSP